MHTPRPWLILLFLSFWLACLPGVPPSPQETDPGTLSQPIIGGKEDLRYPEVGALIKNGSSFCTGTLIAKRVVLTAAHCVDSAVENPAATVEFRIDLPDDGEPKGFKPHFFLFEMSLFKNHPQWTGSLSNGGDIGVGILKQAVTIARPMPVNFQTDASLWSSQSPLFLGYGLLQSTPTRIAADRKYGVEIPIVQTLADRFTHQAVGKSVCHGDSGGPALVWIDGTLKTIGVNSYVTAAGVPGTDRSSCTGSGTSMRTDALASFIQAILATHGDGPEACVKNEECGSCRRCGPGKLCSPQVLQDFPLACKACSTDGDCLGGGCYRFSEGYRCLRPCDPAGCCPEGSYCSTLQTSSNLLRLCLPFEGGCPPLSCKTSKDCGAGEFCEEGSCLPAPVARKSGLCKACITQADCQDTGGYCVGLEGHTFCSQPCGAGDFCPAGYLCKAPYLGLARQCLPEGGGCLFPCAFDSQCPAGLTCLEGLCSEPQGGTYGSSCDPLPCQAPLSCAPTLSGPRCLAPCGIPAGQAGSACKGGIACDAPLSCFSLATDRQICLQPCQTDSDCHKVAGGTCFQGVCSCQSHADCKADFICNRNPEVIGACAPAKAETSCPPSTLCQTFSGESYCVQTKPGNQALGQSCDPLNRCRLGMVCTLTREGSFCFEDCSQTQVCRFGGTCSRPGTPSDVCFCVDDSECGQGRFCRRVFGLLGLCQTKGTSAPCKTDGDCPPAFVCRAGRCLTSAEAEAWKPEPTAEIRPEPPAEPPSDAASAPDAEALPEDPPSPEPTAEIHPEPPPEPPTFLFRGGLSCSASPSPPSFGLSFLLLLGLFALARRLRSAPSTFGGAKVLRPPCGRLGLERFARVLRRKGGTSHLLGVKGCHTPCGWFGGQRPPRNLQTARAASRGVLAEGPHPPTSSNTLGRLLLVSIVGFLQGCNAVGRPCQDDDECGGYLCRQGTCRPCSQGDCPKDGLCREGRCFVGLGSTPEPRPSEILRESASEAHPDLPSTESTARETEGPPTDPPLFDGGNEGLPDALADEPRPEAFLPPLPPLPTFRACPHTSDPTCCIPGTLQRRIEAFSTNASRLGILRSAISPDGKWFATVNDESPIVRVWDVATAKLAYTLLGHTSNLQNVAFSPDSQTLASVGHDAIVRLWDLRDGSKAAELKDHTSTIYTVAFSPDGQWLATAGADRNLRIWKRSDDSLAFKGSGHTDTIWALVFSKDSQTVFSGSSDKTIRAWSITTRQEIWQKTAFQDGVRGLALSPDGTTLAGVALSQDRSLRLLDVTDGKELRSWQIHTSSVYGVAYSPDGTKLATVAADDRLRVWDAASRSLVFEVSAQGDIHSVAYHPDGTALFASSSDQYWLRIDPKTGTVEQRNHASFDRVTTVALSPDGSLVALASARFNEIQIWEISQARLLRTLQGHTAGVRSVAWSPDGKRLASASSDKTIRLWDAATGGLLRTFDPHPMVVSSVAWSLSGNYVASGSWDAKIRIFQTSDGSLLRTIQGHDAEITSVAFVFGDLALLSASVDRTLRLWSFADGSQARTLQTPEPLYTFALSRDQSLLATAGGSDTIRLWKMADFSAIRIVEGHSGPIRSLGFAGGTTALLSASFDQTLRIWETKEGRLLQILRPRGHHVTGLAVAPDSSFVVAGTADGNADIWSLTIQPKPIWEATLQGEIQAAASTQGGHLLAIGSSLDATGLYEAIHDPKNLPKAVLHAAPPPITALAFSPHEGLREQMIAVASGDRKVYLFKTLDQSLLRIFDGHQDQISSLAFHPDGSALAVGSWDGSIRLWDLPTQTVRRTFLADASRVLSIAFSNDGRLLAAGLFNKTILLWETTGPRIGSFQGHTGGVTALAFRGDGERLFSASYDDTIRLWDRRSRQTLQTYRGFSKAVHRLALSQDGLWLASGDGEGVIRLWDTTLHQSIRSFQAHQGPVYALALASDAKTILSGGKDKRLASWSFGTSPRKAFLSRFPLGTLALAFSPDQTAVAASSALREARIYRPSDWRLTRTLSNHTSALHATAISPDSQWIATAGADKRLRIASLSDNKELLNKTTEHTAAIRSVAFRPDSLQVATGGEDRTLLLWSLQSTQVEYRLQGHRGAIYDLAYEPQGSWLASAGEDTEIRLWKPQTGAEDKILTGHTAPIVSLDIHPTTSLLASIDQAGTLRLWNPTQGQGLQSYPLTGRPTRGRFSPNGHFLAISYDDGRIEIRDADTYTVRRILHPQTLPALSLAWSPTSHKLLFGDLLGQIFSFGCDL